MTKENLSPEVIREIVEELAREGLIADSGRRRWSKRTQRYAVVWISDRVAREYGLGKKPN